MDCTMLLRTPLRGGSPMSGRRDLSISESLSMAVKTRSRFISGLHDLAKTGVVVSGVVASVRLPHRPAAHDAPGSPVARFRRLHGVLAPIAALVGREQALPVEEHRAVLLVR